MNIVFVELIIEILIIQVIDGLLGLVLRKLSKKWMEAELITFLVNPKQSICFSESSSHYNRNAHWQKIWMFIMS